MSPVAVHGTGYTDAAAHLNDADQLALMTYRDLTAGLADSGAMAGSDTTAADFAAAYDDAAQATVEAHADLVGALASLGMAVGASLDNHARAEHASNPFGPITDDDPTWQRGTWYDAPATSLPSSLGGDSGSLPGWASWTLDHVGSFVWPDADTDRLRRATTTWRDAATDLGRQTDTQAAASGALGRERSPEVFLACAEILQVEQATTQLAAQMDDLASTCESYATQVETQREVILGIVRDLVRDAVIMQVAGGLLDLVTGPGGTAAATAGVIARIGSRAPEILRALDAIRDAARGFALTLKVVGQGAKDLTVDFRRLWRLRMAARDERGAIQLGGFGKRVTQLRETIGDPRKFSPHELRGMDPNDVESLVKGWKRSAATNGDGVKFSDPDNFGRQVRIMKGYPGNRPDPITHGPYALVSQNGAKYKIPLKGNPTL